MKTFIFSTIILFSSLTLAHAPVGNYSTKPILADQSFLDALKIPISYRHEATGIGLAYITPEMEQKISMNAHYVGKCGGFEALNDSRALSVKQDLDNLASIIESDNLYYRSPMKRVTVEPKEDLRAAINEVNPENLKANVAWLSGFETRYNRGKEPNKHVKELQAQLEEMLKGSKWTYKIDLVNHTSTPQQTLRVHLDGTDLKNEIIVLGGHLDSINQYGIFGGNKAPGADDNASGSSNLIETLRIISQKEPTRRSIEFFWYAGEESGLLGSAEVAAEYKKTGQQVKAVLQLDMTLYPGEGQFVLGSTQDYTTAWLKEYLLEINNAYLNVKIVDDKCGYACSDHASWYKNGFPTLMPFEATMKTMNKNIHTAKDVIDQRSDFLHSAVFSKIAVIFALDLGNATIN